MVWCNNCTSGYIQCLNPMKNYKILLCFTALLLAFLNGLAQFDCSDQSKLLPNDSIIVCSSSTYTIHIPAAATPVTYLWQNGSVADSLTIFQSNWYSVQASDGNCTIRDSVYVLFNSLIQVPQVSNQLFCLNQPAPQLSASGQNLRWYTSPLSTAGSPNAPTPLTTDTGMVSYYVSQTILGCESPKAKIIVEVIDAPTFNLGENVAIPCGASGILLQTVAQKYTSYSWQDGSTRPDFTATVAGNYVLRAENKCGILTDTITTVGCNTRCVQFPTAFTPNNDGLNELFRAGTFCPVTKFKLVVFNRFGQTVFETTNPARGWDGRINGKKADLGNYAYYCIYDDFMLKRELTLKGAVMIMK